MRFTKVSLIRGNFDEGTNILQKARNFACGIFFNHWKVVIQFENDQGEKECISAEFYPDGIKLSFTNRL